MVTIPAAMANSENFRVITSEQIRAARALLRWEQRDLAEASKVSLASVKRLETIHGQLAAQPRTIDAYAAPSRRRAWSSSPRMATGRA